MLKLIKDLGSQKPKPTSNYKARYGLYECPFCQTHFKTRVNSVKQGKTRSCGCLAIKGIKERTTTHGDSATRLYNIWKVMRRRCLTVTNRDYPNYGGRGILIHKDWDSFSGFKEWAVNNGYEEDLTIDRENNDGNYEPNNCRWTTNTIQNRNTRKLSKNNTSGYRGVSRFGKDKWVVRITVDYKQIKILSDECRLKCAYVYDKYIIDNNLEHTRNF